MPRRGAFISTRKANLDPATAGLSGRCHMGADASYGGRMVHFGENLAEHCKNEVIHKRVEFNGRGSDLLRKERACRRLPQVDFLSAGFRKCVRYATFNGIL